MGTLQKAIFALPGSKNWKFLQHFDHSSAQQRSALLESTWPTGDKTSPTGTAVPQNRHPERSAITDGSRDTVLVARSRRTPTVLNLHMLLGALQPPGPALFFAGPRTKATKIIRTANHQGKTTQKAGDAKNLNLMRTINPEFKTLHGPGGWKAIRVPEKIYP
jgi:hypothetical protein